jgi:hypothetical protein
MAAKNMYFFMGNGFVNLKENPEKQRTPLQES